MSSKPVISFEVVPTKVVGGNKVLVTGSWNFNGLSNKSRVAIYQTYPNFYCIYQRSHADNTGSFEFEWTSPEVDVDTPGRIWGILQDTSNTRVAECNIDINITPSLLQNAEHALITSVCPSTTDGVCNTSIFKSGETFNVMVTIKNTGDIEGTNGFSVKLYAGSTVLKGLGMGTIAPGSSKVVYFTNVVMPDHAYDLKVNVYDRVAGTLHPSFDHSMSFTVPYTASVVTCTGNSPHYGDGCTLLKHYDTDGDGTISMDDLNTSIDDLEANVITKAEYDFVEAAYIASTGGINAKCPGCCDKCAGITCNNTCDGTSLWSQKCVNGLCVKDALIESNSTTCGYVAPTPAHGTMNNFTCPTSVDHGKYFEVKCDVHNDGGSAGTFKLRYSINGAVVYTGAHWNIPAGGVTAGAGGVFAPAPDTGTSMTVKLELIRET